MKVNLDRRTFLRWSGALLLGAPLLGKVWLQRAWAQAAGAMKLVADSDPTAKALFYVHQADKAPADKRIDKLGTPGKQQFCHNCNFFLPSGKLGGKEVGKCQLIVSGLVAHDGWCFSWFKKV